MILIPIKWLFHWEYTLFSDIPNCCEAGITAVDWHTGPAQRRLVVGRDISVQGPQQDHGHHPGPRLRKMPLKKWGCLKMLGIFPMK